MNKSISILLIISYMLCICCNDKHGKLQKEITFSKPADDTLSSNKKIISNENKGVNYDVNDSLVQQSRVIRNRLAITIKIEDVKLPISENYTLLDSNLNQLINESTKTAGRQENRGVLEKYKIAEYYLNDSTQFIVSVLGQGFNWVYGSFIKNRNKVTGNLLLAARWSDTGEVQTRHSKLEKRGDNITIGVYKSKLFNDRMFSDSLIIYKFEHDILKFVRGRSSI